MLISHQKVYNELNTSIFFIEQVEAGVFHFYIEHRSQECTAVPILLQYGWVPAWKLPLQLRKEFLNNISKKLTQLRFRIAENEAFKIAHDRRKEHQAPSRASESDLVPALVLSPQVPPKSSKYAIFAQERIIPLEVDNSLLTEMFQDIKARVNKERNVSLLDIDFTPSVKKRKYISDSVSACLQESKRSEPKSTKEQEKRFKSIAIQQDGPLISVTADVLQRQPPEVEPKKIHDVLEISLGDDETESTKELPDFSDFEAERPTEIVDSSKAQAVVVQTERNVKEEIAVHEVKKLYERLDLIPLQDNFYPLSEGIDNDLFGTVFLPFYNKMVSNDCDRRVKYSHNTRFHSNTLIEYSEFKDLFERLAVSESPFKKTSQVICGLCLQILSNPVMIPHCQHRFCLSCLQYNYLTRPSSNGSAIITECPICQVEWKKIFQQDNIPEILITMTADEENDALIDFEMLQHLYTFDSIFQVQLAINELDPKRSGISPENYKIYTEYLDCLETSDEVARARKESLLFPPVGSKRIEPPLLSQSTLKVELAPKKSGRKLIRQKAPKIATLKPRKKKDCDSSHFIKIPLTRNITIAKAPLIVSLISEDESDKDIISRTSQQPSTQTAVNLRDANLVNFTAGLSEVNLRVARKSIGAKLPPIRANPFQGSTPSLVAMKHASSEPSRKRQ